MTARISAALALYAIAAQSLAAQRTDTVVRLASRPVHSGIATLVQELSIGVADGAEVDMLGRVADVAVGRDGTIYVVDKSVPIIRVYDVNGKFVRNIGRRGQGPGEYGSIAGVDVLPDGRLVLWDLGSWRINVYSPTGEVLDHWPTGGSGSADVDGPDFVTVDTAGSVYLRKQIYDTRPVTEMRDGREVSFQRPDFSTRRMIWIRRNASGKLDSVPEPTGPSFPNRIMSVVRENSSSSTMIPYDPHFSSARSSHGYVVSGFGNRYAFELNYPDGRVVSVRRDVRAEPVTSAERTDARNVITARMRTYSPGWSWDGPDVPATKPFFTALAVGTDGRIWVNVTQTKYEMPAPGQPQRSGGGGASTQGGRGSPAMMGSCYQEGITTHDVFEPNGTYVGRVEVPAGLSMRVRRGDYVWGNICTEDDVPTVRRYRIVWR